MTRGQLLPTLLIIIDIGAAAVYATELNWQQVTYWLAAAILTFAVTFPRAFGA